MISFMQKSYLHIPKYQQRNSGKDIHHFLLHILLLIFKIVGLCSCITYVIKRLIGEKKLPRFQNIGKKKVGILLWSSRLSWCHLSGQSHCCGVNSIPGPGTPTCCRHSQGKKKKKKQKKKKIKGCRGGFPSRTQALEAPVLKGDLQLGDPGSGAINMDLLTLAMSPSLQKLSYSLATKQETDVYPPRQL